MPETAKTGLWVDLKTGAIVSTEPVEGRLLVAPGDEIPDTIAAEMRPAAKSEAPEVATVPAAPETATATRKRRKA